MSDSLKPEDEVSSDSDFLKQEAFERARLRGREISKIIAERSQLEGIEAYPALSTIKRLEFEANKNGYRASQWYDPKNCILDTSVGRFGVTRYHIIVQGDEGVTTEGTAGPNCKKIIEGYKAYLASVEPKEVSPSEKRVQQIIERGEHDSVKALERQEEFGEINRITGYITGGR